MLENASYVARTRLFIRAVQAMYYACRTDYPCEGCELGRIASLRGALSWAWRFRS